MHYFAVLQFECFHIYSIFFFFFTTALLKYNSHVLGSPSGVRLSPLSNSRHFHHPRKETSYPLAVTCHSPLPTALGHCSSTFSLSLSLCLFGTYHVNGIIKYSFVSSLFHLAYFHLCCSMYKIFIPCYG